MGLCNLQHMDCALYERKKRFEWYEERLKDIKGIHLFEKKKGADRNFGYFPIIVGDEYCMKRDRLYDLFKEKGIMCRKYFYPLTSDEKCFGDKYRKNDLKTARRLAAQVIVLPLYPDLEFDQVDRIIHTIKEM